MLGMATDLVVPSDIDAVALYIQHLDATGAMVEQWSFSATPLYEPAQNAYVVHFPATLAVESNGKGGDRVRVRAVAFADGPQGPVPMLVRESRTQVPIDYVASLRLPLLWINYGTASDAAPGTGLEDGDAFTRFGSGCPADMTRGDDGVCTTIDVDVATLPRFADDAAAPEPCFDPDAVFRAGDDVVRQPVDRIVDCSIPLGHAYDPLRTQVALVTPSGYAAGNDHVRPLPLNAYRVEAQQLRLLPGACAALSGASAVLVSERVQAPSVTTICSPWQDVPDPVDVQAPEPVTEAGAPDARDVVDATDPVDATDATTEIDASDASVPEVWTFATAPVSWTVGAGGVYVATPDHLQLYPLTPGPMAFEVPATLANVQTIGVDGSGHDILYADKAGALDRIDPTTLVVTPAALCNASAVCVTPGTTEGVSYEKQMGIRRGGNDRLYFTVSVVEAAPPKYYVYTTDLDGVANPRVELSDAVNIVGGDSLLGSYPTATGIVWVKHQATTWFTRYDCSGTSCSQGGGFSAANFDGISNISAVSALESGTVYAFANWSTYDGVTHGGTGGIVRLDATGTLDLRYATNNVASVVRKANTVCWRSAAALSCMDANNAGATVHALPGITLASDLQADATYIYWIDVDGVTLRRRAWNTLP